MEGQTATPATTSESTVNNSENSSKQNTIPWSTGARINADIRPRINVVNPPPPKAATPAAATSSHDNKPAEAPKEESKEAPVEEIVEFSIGSKKYRAPKEAMEQIKQFEKAVQAKQREIAEERKKLQSMSDEEFLKNKGIDPDKWAEERLIKALQSQQLTEEQKKILEYERELQQFRDEKQQELKTKEQIENEKVVDAQRRQISADFTNAWRDSGLPAHPYFGAKVAAELFRSEKNGLGLTMQEAAAKIKKDWISHTKEILGKLAPQQLQEILGNEPLTKWREYDVSRITEKNPVKNDAQPSKRPDNRSASSKKLKFTERGYKEWRESGLDARDWASRKENKQFVVK